MSFGVGFLTPNCSQRLLDIPTREPARDSRVKAFFDSRFASHENARNLEPLVYSHCAGPPYTQQNISVKLLHSYYQARIVAWFQRLVAQSALKVGQWSFIENLTIVAPI